jgi:hypothetical protein
MKLKGKKVLILVETFYNEFEFWYPYYRLKEAGAQVTVVGSGSAETYTSKAGLPVTVDTSADKVSVADYDGVVIPGGYAPDHMRRYPAMVGLVKEVLPRQANWLPPSVMPAGCWRRLTSSADGPSPPTSPSRTTWSTPAATGWTRKPWWTATWSPAAHQTICRRLCGPLSACWLVTDPNRHPVALAGVLAPLKSSTQHTATPAVSPSLRPWPEPHATIYGRPPCRKED